MSHFTVLVKLKPGEYIDATDMDDIKAGVDEALAPYSEHLESEPRRDYFGSSSMLRMVEHYKAPVVKNVQWTEGQVGELVDDHYVLEGGRAIKKDDLLKLLAEHGEDWDGREMGFDDEHGPYRITTYNPDSKWDWYVVGGRWKGQLRIKEGAPQLLGEDGLGRRMAIRDGQPVPEIPPNLSDAALVKNLDIEGLQKEADERIREEWEKFLVMRDCVNKPREKMNDAERKLTEPFGLMSSFFDMGIFDREQVGKDEDGRAVFGPVIVKDIPDFETFKKNYGGNAGMGSFAVLDEDGWHEKGSMGWFGCHSGTTEQYNEFQNSYMERFILNEDPETMLVMVDCHI